MRFAAFVAVFAPLGRADAERYFDRIIPLMEDLAARCTRSPATVRRLPPGALLERLPELRVKGKSLPVEAYVLRSLRGAE
jgi:class 3 adenylate cyclase